jgi:hypothetical protein
LKIFGNGKVWNPQTHEVVLTFPKVEPDELAVIETDDPKLIELARKAGLLVQEDHKPVSEDEAGEPSGEVLTEGQKPIKPEKPSSGRPGRKSSKE